MEKEQVLYFRKKYKGRPVLVICDNEHNFFDNYPSRCLPIWDDANEIVTFVESYQESSGMGSSDFPFVEVVTSYQQIQSFRVFTDRETITGFLKETKAKLGDGAYEHALEIISQMAQNTRPNRIPYYNDLP